jgi:hypothetical protein
VAEPVSRLPVIPSPPAGAAWSATAAARRGQSDHVDHATQGGVRPAAASRPGCAGLVFTPCAVPILGAWRVTCGFADRSGGSSVLVDDAAEESRSPYRAAGSDDVWVVVGRPLSETLVWTVVVEVVLIVGEHGTGVSLVVDQHLVGALGSDAANEPFGVAVRPRRSRGSPDHVDALSGEDGVEGAGELRVPVPDQEPERGDPIAQIRQEIACLLRGPRRRRVRGDAEDVHPAGGDFPSRPARTAGVG